MLQQIPLDSSPNQTFEISLSVNEQNIRLRFFMRWNNIASYWTMRITDIKTETVLVDSIPMIVTDGVQANKNLLAQYDYLRIGSAYLVNVGNVSEQPSSEDLGTNFILIWGDNE